MLAGQGALHDMAMANLRLLAISGFAQNQLDGSLLGGYNETRVNEFETVCSIVDPDFKAAADARAEKGTSKGTATKAVSTPEKIKSFLAERDRVQKAVASKKITSAEEFLRT